MLSMWLTWPARLKITVAVPHQIVHRGLLADVGDVDPHSIRDPVDVEEVAAVVGNQRVDEQDVGAEIREPSCEVAADEPEAAGDHHPRGRDRTRDSLPSFGMGESGVTPARRCRRSTTSANQSRVLPHRS